MSYYTGSAADLEALRTALTAACVTEGWALDGEVLHKGDVHVRLQLSSPYLTILGGTGIDGDNNLTGSAPNISRIGSVAGAALAYPVTYEIFIHASPDEVYFVVNTNVDQYHWLAFGLSSVEGLPGTGVWFGASRGANSQQNIYMDSGGNPASGLPSGECVPALFWHEATSGDSSVIESRIQHGVDGNSWNLNTSSYALSAFFMSVLLDTQPNAWNDDAVLLPIRAYVPRASNKVSLVLDTAHARMLRIDYLDPGEVITLGADKWKIFPWYRKNTGSRSLSSGSNHTGTFGWAIRYDGS